MKNRRRWKKKIPPAMWSDGSFASPAAQTRPQRRRRRRYLSVELDFRAEMNKAPSMDKESMVELKKRFKKMSVVPDENSFSNAILSLKEHQKPAIVIKNTSFPDVRFFYLSNLRLARLCIQAKLSTVFREFTIINEPACIDFFEHYFDDLDLALAQLKYATQLLMKIARYFIQLMEKDDCNTLDRCKYLKVNAIGCMYTVAMTCLPILAYIEKVRQHMLAQDDDPTHENAPPSHIVLAKEDCTIPHTSAFEVEKAAGLVHPDTLRWLEELEEKHGFRMHDDCAQEHPLAA
ncbi:hypothetical protein F2Q69_00038607 [Brassica cretica]|uniref:NOG1 N-terminal helical domain-containing protein n=1 Tax=Brassica cretica TaxID=69181 RepID=A0A8S9SEM2_BRACR|nr:hypothetical protein F2Q69_00038607 [Brassica cretica]